MQINLIMILVLNFLVNGLLLLGTNRLCGFPPGIKRCALAAAAGSLYSGICLLPGFTAMGNVFLRMLCLVGMGIIAFGWSTGSVRKTLVFVLLEMALGGISSGIGEGSAAGLLLSAMVVWILCSAGLHNGVGKRSYVSVCLEYRGKTIELLALRDTGNALYDPVSGEPVLVLGAQIAEKLVGLNEDMLAAPVETMIQYRLPGLRLLPYSAVGQKSGMLLGIRLEKVWIDGKPAGTVVAFAPQKLDREGTFQALAGGMV